MILSSKPEPKLPAPPGEPVGPAEPAAGPVGLVAATAAASVGGASPLAAAALATVAPLAVAPLAAASLLSALVSPLRPLCDAKLRVACSGVSMRHLWRSVSTICPAAGWRLGARDNLQRPPRTRVPPCKTRTSAVCPGSRIVVNGQNCGRPHSSEMVVMIAQPAHKIEAAPGPAATSSTCPMLIGGLQAWGATSLLHLLAHSCCQ